MYNLVWENSDLNEKGSLRLNIIAPILLISHLKLSLLKECIERPWTSFLLDKLQSNIVLLDEKDLEEKLSKWYSVAVTDVQDLLLYLKLNEELIKTLLWILNTLYAINITQFLSQLKDNTPFIEELLLVNSQNMLNYTVKYKKISPIRRTLEIKPIKLQREDKTFLTSILPRLFLQNFTEIADSVYSTSFTTSVKELIAKYTAIEKGNFYNMFPNHPFEEQLPFGKKKDLAKIVNIFMLTYLKTDSFELQSVLKLLKVNLTSMPDLDFVDNFFNS